MKVKLKGRASSLVGGILWGIGFSYCAMVFMAMILAFLIHMGYFAPEKIGYGVMMILMVSSLIGAVSAQTMIKHRKLLVCLVNGTGYFATLLLTTALFFGGQYEAVGETALLVLCGSVVAGMIGLPSRKMKNGRNIGKYYC